MLECIDYKEFELSASNFAVMGYTISEISFLEYQIDCLIVAINEQQPTLATSLNPRFPRDFDNKIDFIIGLIAINPTLKQVPIFGDGSVNLNWLYFQLREIFGARAALVHGKVNVTLEVEGYPLYDMARYTSGKKNEPISITRTEFGAGFLANLVETTNHLSHYFSRLKLTWRGKHDPEEDYQSQKEIAGNWQAIEELADECGLTLSDMLNLKIW